MQRGGADDADTSGGEDDTEPIPVARDDTLYPATNEPLAPLTDLSFTFERHPREVRARRKRPSLGFSRPQRLSRRQIAAGGAVAAAAALAGVGAWLLWPAESSPAGPEPSSGPSDEAGRPDVERLRRLLPTGFDNSCWPDASSPLTSAQLACGPAADLPGATSSRFILATAGANIEDLAGSTLAGAKVVVCPGSIQSPGPWRRNATPSTVAGTLTCATRGDRAIVAWTTTADRLVSVIEAGPDGPALPQLYAWWTTHS